jgi:hypothetical protein
MQLKHPAITITFQRTVTTPLTLCLSSGVHFNVASLLFFLFFTLPSFLYPSVRTLRFCPNQRLSILGVINFLPSP